VAIHLTPALTKVQEEVFAKCKRLPIDNHIRCWNN